MGADLSLRHRSGLYNLIINRGLQSMGVRSFGLALGFISMALLSRNLGASEFGKYAILLSLCLFCVVPIKLGFDHTVLKFAAEYWAAKEFNLMNDMAVFGLKLTFVTTMGMTVLVVSIYYLFHHLFYAITPLDITFMLSLSIILAIIGICSQFFRAAEMIFYAQFFEQVFRSAVLIGLILCTTSLGYQLSSTQGMGLTVIAAGLAFVALAITFLRRVSSNSWRLEAKAEERSKWMRMSWPMFGASVAAQALAQMSILLLGVMASTADAGLFAVIARLSIFVTFALVALNSISAPLIAAAFIQRNTEELAKIAKFNARLSAALGATVCLILAVFGKTILGFFGPEFPAAYSALLVLLAGTLIGAVTGPVGYLLTMTNQQYFFFWSSLICALLTLIVTVLAIYTFGMIGAAIGALFGQVYQNLSRWYVVRKRLGIDASFLGLPARPVASING